MMNVVSEKLYGENFAEKVESRIQNCSLMSILWIGEKELCTKESSTKKSINPLMRDLPKWSDTL